MPRNVSALPLEVSADASPFFSARAAAGRPGQLSVDFGRFVKPQKSLIGINAAGFVRAY